MFVSEIFMPDFMEKYIQHSLTKMQQSGASAVELEKYTADMAEFKELYKNPLVKFGMTFTEPFPVGFLVALISAVVLRKQAA